MVNLRHKSRILYGYGVLPGTNVCSGNDNSKQYRIGYFGDGCANTLNCINAGQAETINIGITNTQTGHWGDTDNEFWQQKDWETLASYSYGTFGTPTVKQHGCMMRTTCVGGYTHLSEFCIPRIDATVQSSTFNSVTIRIQWMGDIYTTADTVINVYKDDGTGVYTSIATATVPANVQGATNGYLPYSDIVFTGSDVGKSFHFKGEITTPYGTSMADMYITIGTTISDIPFPTAPKNSFVQFGEADCDCGSQRHVCLPVKSLSDLQFQMVIDAGSAGIFGDFPSLLGDGITAGAQFFLSLCDNCTMPDDVTHARDLTDKASILSWVNVPDTFVWVNNTIDWTWLQAYFIANVPVGSCFQICLIKRIPADGAPGEWIDTVAGCSPCFKRIATNKCFTSVLKYRSNQDSMCFFYSQDANYYNSIRLPMLLKSMLPVSEDEVYTYSDGTYETLSAFLAKQYELHVGRLNKNQHWRISIGLKHDTVLLDDSDNSQENAQITCKEQYKPDWTDTVNNTSVEYPLTKATTQILINQDLCSTNSNC